MFYPPKGLCEAEPEWGPFDYFHFVSREGCLTLYIYMRKLSFFKSWKCFIPWRDSAKAEPNGVHLIFFPFYCVCGTVLTLPKSAFSGGLSEILKMFYCRMVWDGLSMKRVLQCSSYFVGIWKIYIYTYVCTRNLLLLFFGNFSRRGPVRAAVVQLAS